MQVCISSRLIFFKKTLMTDVYDLDLAVLFTHPDHQRRGAGSMLVKWGCDKADEHGIISWLGASPAGLQTYLKQGFEVVEEYELDLRPWGVDATTIKRNLIRQPKKKL